jgi:uncharacterized protein involved in exopolysaccharide biosynthesis
MRRAFTFVVIAAIVVAAITYIVTGFLKQTFRGTESLYFPQAQGSGLGGSPLKSALGGMNQGADPAGVPLILESRSCALYCIRSMHLDDQWFPNEENRKKREFRALQRFTGAFDVKIDKTGFLVGTMDGDTPEECERILNTAIKFLGQRSADLSVNVSTKNREFIETRVTESQRKVQDLEDSLIATMQSAPQSDYDEFEKQYLATLVLLTQAQVDASRAEKKVESLQSDYDRIFNAAGSTSPGDVLAISTLSTNLTSLTDELERRRLAFADAMKQYTKDSPEYKQAFDMLQNAEHMSKRIVQSGKDLTKEGVAPQLADAKSDAVGLQHAAKEFQRIFLEKFEGPAKTAPTEYAKVERLKREFEASLDGYTSLEADLEMAKIAEARDPSRFEVVDYPYPDPTPVAPRRVLISGAVFLISMGLFSLPLLLRKGDSNQDDD